MPLVDCEFIDLPRLSDARGNLSFVEGGKHIPFEIKRVYHLYDIPERAERGAHAHRALHQFILPMSGSFDVVLDDGTEQSRFHLHSPCRGLYVCPMMWRHLDNFSPGAVCVVLASAYYDEADYIRDYSEFLSLAGQT